MEYNTSQKRAILDYFEANPNKQVSIEQIFDSVKAKTGKSTVYRLVNSFVKEGLIRRLRDEVNMQIVYQLLKADDDCASHFHMKCLNCGKIFHLKCILQITYNVLQLLQLNVQIYFKMQGEK